MSTANVHVDTADFSRFADALKRAAPEIRTRLRPRLQEAGELVAEEARSRAGEVSATVPSSIKVRVTGAASVAIVAGGSGVPMAGLLELGNAGRNGGATFRHPVYGNRHAWANQKMHPYLVPALDARAHEAVDAIAKVLDDAVEVATRGE